MDIRLPKLGEGADSGSVVTVFVKPGDQIKPNQPLIELENEKAIATIPSTAGGTVSAVHVKPGDKISVGQLLVTLSNGGAAPAAADAAQSAPARPAGAPKRAPAPAPEPELEAEAVEPEAGGPEPAASPSVRKIARELGIELRRVRGSERGGRIVLEDVKAYIQRLQRAGSERKPAAGAPASSPRPAAAPSVDFSKWGPVTSAPITSIRRTIAERMVGSWTTIPHVTQFDEADITDLLALKQRADAAYEQRGVKLTLTALLLPVLADRLKAHPVFNSSFDEAAGAIVAKQYYHIGIAVDTEAGLMVPVLKDVDKKSLLDLSKELNALVEKTRSRKISAEELQGSTFSISNQGGIGGAHFTPIIKPPDVAILGIGRGALKPVVRPSGAVEARMMLPLALSYDHRVIDGGSAARFIRDLVQALQQPNASRVTLS